MNGRKAIIAAICTGQAMLVWNRLLDGQEAARLQIDPDRLMDTPGGRIQWVPSPVVRSQNIITASSPADADAFAEAIIRALAQRQ